MRQPDELWTSYLLRRLESEGLEFGEFSIGWDGEGRYSHYIKCDFNSSQSIDLMRYNNIHITPTPKICSFQELTNLFGTSISEGIDLCAPDGESWYFALSPEGVVVHDSISEVKFLEYKHSESYVAPDVLDDIMAYVLDNQTTARPVPRVFAEGPVEAPRKMEIEDPRLDEILATVRNIHTIAAGRAVALQEEHSYLADLYTRTINDDSNNLQVLEHEGKRIPYVLVNSFQIEGNVGKPSNNLYFVSKDLAPEVWQQQVVALHESMCAKIGHEEALAAELPFVKVLGKVDEYVAWRSALEA